MSQRELRDFGILQSGLADEPSLRWAATDLTGPLRVACERLDLSPVAAGALGRCLIGTVLLQRMFIKTPNRLVTAISGGGPLSRVMGEIDEAGNIRGMVSNPRLEIPLAHPEELGVGRAIGDGLLQVRREAKSGDYLSHVELTAGRISDAMTHYLEQSEQTRSAAVTGVLATAEGISAAGGLMIELLPGSSDDALSALESRLEALPSASRLLAAEGLDGLLGAVLGKHRRTLGETRAIHYRCRCSSSTIRRYLAAMSVEEARDLLTESGDLEAECVFCGSKYRYRVEDLGPEFDSVEPR